MLDPAADLGTIANQDFGESFLVDDGTPAGRAVVGRYRGPFQRLALGIGVESYAPAVVLTEAAAAGLAHGTGLTRSKTGQSYSVTEIQPDGIGWVVLILTEA